MPEPVDRKEPMKNDEIETASRTDHPDRDEARRERDEREMRDREELGRPSSEARERALAEDVTERRDREAREEADRIEEHPPESQKDIQQRRTTDRGTDVGTSEPGMPPRTDAAPTEDSPAREPTERVERMEEAGSADEVEREER